jgi:hypothetical protein
MGDGSVDLPWQRYIFKNIYLRGQIAWEDLFQALLNQTSSACGMHLVDFDTLAGPPDGTTWRQKMMDACRLVESVSNMGGADLCVLDRLMEHMHQIKPDGQWKIPTNDRFPVKLSDNAIEDTENICLGQDVHQNQKSCQAFAFEDQILAMMNERSMAESLLLDKQNEIQLVKDNCGARLQAAKSTYQQQLDQQQTQGDKRLREAEAAFTQRLTKLGSDHAVEKEASRQQLIHASRMDERRMKNGFLMAAPREQRLLAALSQGNSKLKRLSSESTRRQNFDQQHQQVTARDCESSLLIARLQAVNGNLIEKLSAIAKQLNEIQKEKDDLQKDYENLRNERNEDATNNKETEKQLRATLKESEKAFELKLAQKDNMLERARRAEAQLNSAKSLVIVLEKRLETAEEKVAERTRVQALHALHKDHKEALTLLKEQHGVETEAQRAELEGLERKFSDQAKELTRVEAWSTGLKDELTRVEAALKGQSQLFKQTVQPLRDEVSRLKSEMTDKDAAIIYLKRTLGDREQALARQEFLSSKSQALERQKLQQDKSLRKRERDLQRRMEDFEAEMLRRLSEWDQKAQVPPARDTNVPQRRYSRDGVKRKSPSASQESAAKGKSRGSNKRGQKLASSLIIPGQSLTMAGVVQQISRKHGASRVVIDEPSDSDDSEVEL